MPGVSFEVMMHLGTLLAVLIYFRSRLFDLIKSVYTPSMKDERMMIVLLIVGTIPAGVIGVLFKDFFEAAFSNPRMSAIMLFVTGLILLSSHFAVKGKKKMSLAGAIIMGFGQALAIFPGISRSGTTIVSGMWAKVEPSKAAEFSFLLAIPAIGGAAVLNIKDLMLLDKTALGQYAVGTLFSFIMGLIAVYLVLATIRRGKFSYFAYYCFAAGALGLYLSV